MKKDGSYVTVHTKDASEVNLAFEFRAKPEVKKLWDEAREVMNKLSNISEKEFNARFSKDMQKHGIGSGTSDAAPFIGWWRDPREGEAWALNRILRTQAEQKEVDVERLREMLDVLKRIANQK